MKKMFIVAFIVGVLAACGGKKKSEDTAGPGTSAEPAMTPDAAPAEGEGSAAAPEGAGSGS